MLNVLLPSTSRYMARQMKDPYCVLARTHSYRARSAFKLLEMDDKLKFLKPNKVILDIGCAPGSWSQVVVERCKLWPKEEGNSGYLIGVDLQHLLPIPGADIMGESDITSPEVHQKIRNKLNSRKVDIILSDMAHNPVGDTSIDNLRLIQLLRTVYRLFHPLDPASPPSIELASNGIFMCKLFDGQETQQFLNELRQRFSKIRILKPGASRESSSEIYIYCTNPANQDNQKRARNRTKSTEQPKH
ncbi:hypothetical protein WR25_06728 [Diploscapter pachys]|uniref:rRNA methyltransferase 2, mitochondrial n=1 Tax=Diploscapter pachys TaxID=2018661 RepID=A0A2A2KWB9_9BILA|nr:hypothetical protein WR25_06728 [Diploscapter pachys]